MPDQAAQTELLIMAVAKAVMCLLIVGGVAYCMVSGREIQQPVLEVILLALGAYFGFSAKLYRDSVSNGKARAKGMWIEYRKEDKNGGE